MILRNALLGLLAIRPMTGYELTLMFRRTLAHAWSAHHSQIYPLLQRMEADGLVTAGERTGPRRSRTYTITDLGRSAVVSWLSDTMPDETSRNEAVLRSFLVWLMDPEAARAFFREIAERHRALLAEYERRAIESAGRPSTPIGASGRIALEAGLRLERAMVEWAEWAEFEVQRPPLNEATEDG